ncbi:MAG: hypothetical protein ACI89L_001484 [Phycisphaerales bacterium]|jgi:hypothetical protein
MKFLCTLAALAAVGIVASSSSASNIPKMTLEQVYDASDAIVHGRVVAQQSKWESVGGNNLIFTYTDVEVYSSLKGQGQARATMVTVRTVGGHVDGYNQALIGEAVLTKGEEVVLFLENEAGWSAPAVVGFFQGKYAVDQTSMGPQIVRDTGAEAGKAPRFDQMQAGEDFLSELNRISQRGPGERAAEGVNMLAPVVSERELTGELGVFARTVSRGTFSTDINADGLIDMNDVPEFVDAFVNQSMDADVNADGIVDMGDLQRLIEDLGL